MVQAYTSLRLDPRIFRASPKYTRPLCGALNCVGRGRFLTNHLINHAIQTTRERKTNKHQVGVDCPHKVCIGTELVVGDTYAPDLTFNPTSFAGDAPSFHVRRQDTEHERSSKAFQNAVIIRTDHLNGFK